MSKVLSEEHVNRIRVMFRKTLGRDLSAEEQRYLGLSSGVISIDDLELSQSDDNKLKTAKSA